MRKAVRQGFYPGGLTPHRFCKVPVEVRTGKKPRHKLAVEPHEAEILRTMVRHQICEVHVSERHRELSEGEAVPMARHHFAWRRGPRWLESRNVSCFGRHCLKPHGFGRLTAP